jgi:hypothetical protein
MKVGMTLSLARVVDRLGIATCWPQRARIVCCGVPEIVLIVSDYLWANLIWGKICMAIVMVG